ncbi:MAG: hypothetical protein Q9M92_04655 [Enterobacterales bacterium]|nr:hypothetical protein [Enterobacterales bacterium]
MQDNASNILENSPLAYVICDSKQRILSCNEKFLQDMDLKQAQVLGQLYPSLPLELIDKKGQVVEKFSNTGQANRRFHYWHNVYQQVPAMTIHYFIIAEEDSQGDRLHSIKLPKRASWIEFLDYEVSRSRRYANPLSILKLQVILDNQPADIGQEAICQSIKDTLMDELRWADMIGNTSEGCYLMVLPETPFAALDQLKHKISKAICLEIKQLSNQIECQIVFGSAHWGKSDDSEKLLKRARESLVKSLETLLEK